METILNEIIDFCEHEINSFLDKFKGELPYPAQLIDRMGQLGLFGINIPEQFGGSEIPISLNLKINQILSRYWLAIPALYGTHLRTNQYFLELGTQVQKAKFLPKMAKGELIAAHAYHEKAIRQADNFKTVIRERNGKFFLTGTKEWVTNAQHCNFMVVVARRERTNDSKLPNCSAVIVWPNSPGLALADEHYRKGIEGISLRRVNFNEIEISEDDFIGGKETCALNFISQFRPISSLNFAARCVGIAESLIELIKPYLMIEERDELSKGVIYHKWAELLMIKESIAAYFENSVALNELGRLTNSQAHRTKVFCSKSLQDLVTYGRMLSGGTSFASDDYSLIRQLNDAGSLSLIDTPNDILLTWSGKEELTNE